MDVLCKLERIRTTGYEDDAGPRFEVGRLIPARDSVTMQAESESSKLKQQFAPVVSRNTSFANGDVWSSSNQRCSVATLSASIHINGAGQTASIRFVRFRDSSVSSLMNNISRDEVYVGTTLVSQALSAGRVSPM